MENLKFSTKLWDSRVGFVDFFNFQMNSFNTDEETHKIIKKYAGFRVEILTFNQVTKTLV